MRSRRTGLRASVGAVRGPRLDWPPERRRRAATPSRARSHRLGVRADPGAARAGAERLRAGRVLRALVGALRLQALGAAARGGCRRRASACCRARARTPASSTSAAGSRSRSRSSRTTTRPRSSRSRAPRPGVGGILRDVVAMGARPIALLDGLRFGAPDWHFRRAVAGIGHYGNCVGVPTVGGETVFDEAYAANPLVNAMCVGLLPAERVLRAKATGTGNLIVLYGALTGRDGIGGASVLASQDLEGSDEKRPSRPDRRPVPRQGADRGVARPRRARPRRRPAGLRRGRARLLARRDGRRRRRRRRPPRPRAAPRARPRAVGDHDLRVAGADGRGRRAGAARRGARRLRALGAAVHGDRRGHRPRRAAGVLTAARPSARSRPSS